MNLYGYTESPRKSPVYKEKVPSFVGTKSKVKTAALNVIRIEERQTILEIGGIAHLLTKHGLRASLTIYNSWQERYWKRSECIKHAADPDRKSVV